MPWRKWISSSVLTIQIGDCSAERENGFNFVLPMKVNLLCNLNKLRSHHAHLEDSDTFPVNWLQGAVCFRGRYDLKMKIFRPHISVLKKESLCIAEISRLKLATSCCSCQWWKCSGTSFKVHISPTIFSPSSVNLEQKFKMTASCY